MIKIKLQNLIRFITFQRFTTTTTHQNGEIWIPTVQLLTKTCKKIKFVFEILLLGIQKLKKIILSQPTGRARILTLRTRCDQYQSPICLRYLAVVGFLFSVILIVFILYFCYYWGGKVYVEFLLITIMPEIDCTHQRYRTYTRYHVYRSWKSIYNVNLHVFLLLLEEKCMQSFYSCQESIARIKDTVSALDVMCIGHESQFKCKFTIFCYHWEIKCM